MEDNADLHDWELLHGPDFTDNYVLLDEDPSNFAIKEDYFAFDSGSSQRLQSEESESGGIDSDNPSFPDSDSNAFFESPEEHLGFAGMTLQIQNPGGFLSDESSDEQRSVMEMGSEESERLGGEGEGSDRSDSREMTEVGGDAAINEGEKRERNSGGFLSDELSDGQRSLANSEQAKLGSSEASVMVMGSEESDSGCGREDEGSDRSDTREMTEIGGDGFWSDELSDGRRSLGDCEHVELGRLEMGSEESDRSDTREMTEIGGDAAINEGEKREKTWWKVPLGLLKYCLVGMRPVWSLSIAAAVFGLVMLWRKLYRMKQKSRIIPLKLAIDEKKTSQFAARSARLNAAFSVVRRMPTIRPSLQEGVATQWAALPLR